MTQNQYREKLRALCGALTDAELDARIAPLTADGAATRVLRERIAAAGPEAPVFTASSLLRTTVPQVAARNVREIAVFWLSAETELPPEADAAMEDWMRVNGLVPDRLRREMAYREYLRGELSVTDAKGRATLNERYADEHVTALLPRRALSVRATDAGMIPAGAECLLDLTGDGLRAVADWWYGGASGQFSPRERTLMERYLAFGGVARRREITRDRLPAERTGAPVHGCRLLTLLEIFARETGERAAEAYDKLLLAVTGGGAGYAEGGSYVYNETTATFRSYRSNALQALRADREAVRERLLAALTTEKLRAVARATARLMLEDHAALLRAQITLLAERPVAYGDCLLRAADVLLAASVRNAGSETLADAYLAFYERVLLDSVPEEDGTDHAVLPGDALNDPYFRSGNLLREWLRGAPVPEELLPALARSGCSGSAYSDPLGAMVFRSLLYHADRAAGRAPEDCGKPVWLPLPERAAKDPARSLALLDEARECAERGGKALLRSLRDFAPHPLETVPGSMLIGGWDGCVLRAALTLRASALRLNAPLPDGEQAGVLLMRVKTDLHECDRLLTRRCDDLQLATEATESQTAGGSPVVSLLLLAQTALLRAAVEAELARLEMDEIWAEDVVRLFIRPTGNALSDAGAYLNAADAPALRPYVDPAVTAEHRRRLAEDAQKYARQFFRAGGTIPARLHRLNPDGGDFYRAEYDRWSKEFGIPADCPLPGPLPLRSGDEPAESADAFEEVYMSTFDSVSGSDPAHRVDVEAALFKQIANGKTILLQMNQIVDNLSMLGLLYVPGFRWLCRRGVIALSCFREIHSPEIYLMNNLARPGFRFSSSDAYAVPENATGAELTESCRGVMLRSLRERTFLADEFPVDRREEMEYLFDAYLMLFECFQPADLRRFHQNPAFRWPRTPTTMPENVPLDVVLARRVELLRAKSGGRTDTSDAFAEYLRRWGTMNDRSSYDNAIDAALAAAETDGERALLEKFRRVVHQCYFISNGKMSSRTVMLTETDPELVVPERGVIVSGNDAVAPKYILNEIRAPGGTPDASWSDLGERAMECRAVERAWRTARRDVLAQKKQSATGFDYTVVRDEVVVRSITPRTSEGKVVTVGSAPAGQAPTDTVEVIK